MRNPIAGKRCLTINRIQAFTKKINNEGPLEKAVNKKLPVAFQPTKDAT